MRRTSKADSSPWAYSEVFPYMKPDCIIISGPKALWRGLWHSVSYEKVLLTRYKGTARIKTSRGGQKRGTFTAEGVPSIREDWELERPATWGNQVILWTQRGRMTADVGNWFEIMILSGKIWGTLLEEIERRNRSG